MQSPLNRNATSSTDIILLNNFRPSEDTEDLGSLNVDVIEQTDFERQLAAQFDSSLIKREEEQDRKRYHTLETEIRSVQKKFLVWQSEKQKISIGTHGGSHKYDLSVIERHLKQYEKELGQLFEQKLHLEERANERADRQKTIRQDLANQHPVTRHTPKGKQDDEEVPQWREYSFTTPLLEEQNQSLRDHHPHDVLDTVSDDDGLVPDADNDDATSSGVLRDYKDDGDPLAFSTRFSAWCDERKSTYESLNGTLSSVSLDNIEYCPVSPDVDYSGGLRVPGELHERLLDYQHTTIEWLWRLHKEQAGGILGDEMGLGKTVQTIAFLAGLKYSRLLEGPILVVCPATVMTQWVKEFHVWWSPFRVAIEHVSGAYYSSDHAIKESLMDIISSQGHVLITSYSTLQRQSTALMNVPWHYVILDEGHKIRNPDALITLVAKQFRTPHRIILSGSPIQNSLKELWSLFDFVFPGRLGTLPIFLNQFEIPIRQGAYANASPVQVLTAHKCAVVLRDLISPYLLRRMKSEVAHSLPKKTEQVLFCHLTRFQRMIYQEFLKSPEMQAIFEGRKQLLYGIDILRKICNHPDLLRRTTAFQKVDYGKPSRSGKMNVLMSLLHLWHQQKHRALIFCQTRQMLDIIEKAVQANSFVYRRMDGSTEIRSRMSLIDEFNQCPSIFIFLLTTRVGGLGVNLVGADRVLIFDPDWNPSTDIQARERAWRLGQTRPVTIYRLMTSGTIEEKIYHRQIYKQFLTNKVLKDPRQRRFFKSTDLHDLFSLTTKADDPQTANETADMFAAIQPHVMLHDDQEKMKKTFLILNEEKDTGEEEEEEEKDKEEVIVDVDFVNRESPKKKGRVLGVEGYLGHIPMKREESIDDIHRIDGLSRVKSFSNISNHDTQFSSTENPTVDETKVLRQLFNQGGLHTALHHDKIMEAATPEQLLVQKDAERIAHQAAESLRHSARQRSKSAYFEPTWTGQSGSAGLPRFGRERQQPAASRLSEKAPIFSGKLSSLAEGPPSSAALLQRLKRQEEPVPAENNLASSRQDLIQRLHQFLRNRNNRASTAEILEEFGLKITGTDVPVFRSMLREIATFQKQDSNVGFWHLKSEYQTI